MKLLFLGTGAAEGIPCFGCDCPRCEAARYESGKDRRQRTALLVSGSDHKLLVDSPPEISSMLQRKDFSDISAILLTHEHYDHIGGLPEFEYWSSRLLHVFAGYDVLPKVSFTPRLSARVLPAAFHSHSPLRFGSLQVTPFKVMHHVPCYGFLFEEWGKKVAYYSDSSQEFSEFHIRLLAEVDMAIFHTPTFEQMEHHISVQELLNLLQRYPTRRPVVTHINHHNRRHDELVQALAPHNVMVAYDGLELEIH
jgi:phosphoribosyl 1,2-cyclic phosphate phosphodiesterase